MCCLSASWVLEDKGYRVGILESQNCHSGHMQESQMVGEELRTDMCFYLGGWGELGLTMKGVFVGTGSGPRDNMAVGQNPVTLGTPGITSFFLIILIIVG